jgi:hypothetical protein
LVELDLRGHPRVIQETLAHRGEGVRLGVRTLGGSVVLELEGASGSTAWIQTTRDAVSGPWESLQEIKLGETGTATVPWTIGAADATRFYRAVSE